MKPLEDYSIGHRIAISFIIVVVVLLLLALIGWLSGGWEEVKAQEALSSRFDGDLIELDKEAVKQAYHDQVVHLFAIWMKDETGQPGRMTVGVRQARRAYIEAMTKIEERERK